VLPRSRTGYYQEAKAAGVMDGFKKLVPKKCKVLRDGNIVVLDAHELVPGQWQH
jgi:sodium/potassium-transporting ATPase subunit alpha